MSNLREREPRERDNGVIKEAQLGVNTKNGAAPNKPDSYPPNGPAEERVWQGSIEVLDIVPHGGHYEGVVSHLGLYERISAHPPSKVSLKAYEFSKQMAEVLQCKLHPLREQWPENFQTYIPDGNDVGLYFYPKKLLERPSKKYSTLLKFITKNDLMLKTCMGDVELLIFPSTQLRADCQTLNDNFFMWGVFRHVNGNLSNQLFYFGFLQRGSLRHILRLHIETIM
ncbi:RING/FYVE/PHD zinc finger superfamily protein [Quillaja saponaria]|uniref:RING/FYVE/PHD zinc finger superfamily protein n=1 Tax=Quillaja saponaria TaxID=32244 RepID=A0AAD7P5Z2_QUISA|nr:RING/FYVE/PHD zinc finger superfamily protein [Quillaja saponaria]